jgi:hypothetical protein
MTSEYFFKLYPPLSMQLQGIRAKTAGLEVSIMYPPLSMQLQGRIHYADFESSSFGSYSLQLHAKGRSNKY